MPKTNQWESVLQAFSQWNWFCYFKVVFGNSAFNNEISKTLAFWSSIKYFCHSEVVSWIVDRFSDSSSDSECVEAVSAGKSVGNACFRDVWDALFWLLNQLTDNSHALASVVPDTYFLLQRCLKMKRTKPSLADKQLNHQFNQSSHACLLLATSNISSILGAKGHHSEHPDDRLIEVVDEPNKSFSLLPNKLSAVQTNVDTSIELHLLGNLLSPDVTQNSQNSVDDFWFLLFTATVWARKFSKTCCK